MHLSFFQGDITPPMNHPLCAGWYPPAKGVSENLQALGVVLFPEDNLPIILCALDWAELSNTEYDRWRFLLAEAAGTQSDRVAIHCIHAHDSPWPDRGAQRILDEAGLEKIIMDYDWCEAVIQKTAECVRMSLKQKHPVTEVHHGRAKVEEVASNRRVMGPDGKVKGVRWTVCADEALRAEPEGTIDPYLKTISFWNGSKKLVSLHYYAVHPTSYDGTGMTSADFVGISRERLADEEAVPHIYFTECAGNITCGKYNDGAADNRELFTRKILEAMRESEKTSSSVVNPPLAWKTRDVILPPREDQPGRELRECLCQKGLSTAVKSRAALILAYQNRGKAGISISALHLGDEIVVVHTPGESFIEYQLYAQGLRPDAMVVVPSYGDCGPGYIPLEKSYAEGGYETYDSFCSEKSEGILRDAIAAVVAT